MKKMLSSLLGAGLVVLLLMQACGPDPVPVPPQPDGGSWVECDELDAGTCAPGEQCRYVDVYDRYLCLRPCDSTLACADLGVECCGGEDGGPGGYCQPKDQCDWLNSGSGDAGSDGGAGNDGGVNSGDAGSDAGQGEPDAGSGADAGTSVDAGTGVDAGTDGGSPVPTLIRLMAANITSDNNQSYDPGHGIRIFQGTHPDVVMIQEFKYGDNSPTAIRQFVDTTFGPSFSYFRESGAGIPNGVISRWPIVASGEWDDTQVGDRDFTWARIDVPGPRDLWVVSVHLLTSSATVRNTEATNLVSLIRANIPDEDYLAIGGDFNSDNRGEGLFSTFSQVVTTAGPYPADRNGNDNTNAARAKPYDHVLVDGDLRQYQVATVIGGSTFSAGLVADTRVYSPISEIAPALSTDSGATNMQHMGIIKDFLIPGGTATASVTVRSPNGGESWVGGSVHNITWTSSGVANVKLEYTLDGSNWTTVTSSTAASTSSYAWTVPSSPTSTARVRVSDASNPALSDTSGAAFTITPSGGGGTGTVFINEVLIDEPGSDVAYEFVELVNSGTAAVDLSGWTISDAAQVRHAFTNGTMLGAGQAIVVFGGASGIPGGLSNAVAASTNALGLSNGGDTVTVKNAGGTVVDSSPFSSSLIVEGVSANRSIDGTSGTPFVLHDSVSSRSSSPGTRADGSPF